MLANWAPALLHWQIGSADGTLSKSDLLTRVYALAAMYSEVAERRRLAQDQGAVDLKGLYNDLKIRLETQFELTKEQMVHVYDLWFLN
jgi:hypothetical protein